MSRRRFQRAEDVPLGGVCEAYSCQQWVRVRVVRPADRTGAFKVEREAKKSGCGPEMLPRWFWELRPIEGAPEQTPRSKPREWPAVYLELAAQVASLAGAS